MTRRPFLEQTSRGLSVVFLLSFEFFSNLLQQRSDGQRLGTDVFTLQAVDAVGRQSMILHSAVVHHSGIAVLELSSALKIHVKR